MADIEVKSLYGRSLCDNNARASISSINTKLENIEKYGATGTLVNFKGTVDTPEDLPTANNNIGDGYICKSDNHLYIYGADNVWLDAGKFQGDSGKGISSIENWYCISDSKDTVPDSDDDGWTTTMPEWEQDKYLWTKMKITYDDSSIGYTVPYCSSTWDAVNTLVKITDTKFTVVDGQIESLVSDTTITKDGNTIKLKDAYNDTVTTINDINSTIAEQTKTIESLNGSVTSIDTKVNNLNRDLTSTTSTISSIQEDVANCATKEQLSTIEQTATSLTTRVTDVEKNKLSTSEFSTQFKQTAKEFDFQIGDSSQDDTHVLISKSGLVVDGGNFVIKNDDHEALFELDSNGGLVIKNYATLEDVDNAISEVIIEYCQSDSNTSCEGCTWSTTPPEWAEGKYIWQRTKYIFIDETKDPVYSSPVCISGKNGIDGKQGEAGKDGTSVTIKGSVATTDDLPTEGNTVGDGYLVEADGHLYVWTATETWIDVGQIQGEQGKDGQTYYWHVAYCNMDEDYNISDFSIIESAGRAYMGTYVDTTEADSTDSSKYTWVKIKGEDGKDGQDGQNGSSVKTLETDYQYTQTEITQKSANGYQTTWDVDDASGVNTGDTVLIKVYNTTKQGDSFIIAVADSVPDTSSLLATSKGLLDKGDTGADGTTGADGQDGKGITSIEVLYLVTDSKDTAPATDNAGWSATVPAWKFEKYLWVMDKITYNTGDIEYTTPRLDNLWESITVVNDTVKSHTSEIKNLGDSIETLVEDTSITDENGETVKLKQAYTETKQTVDSINHSVVQNFETIDKMAEMITNTNSKANTLEQTLTTTTSRISDLSETFSKNLVNLNVCEAGYINESGEFAEDSTKYVSDYIPVPESRTMTLQIWNPDKISVVWDVTNYDKDKVFDSSSYNPATMDSEYMSQELGPITDENIVYLRFSWTIGDNVKVMISNGTTVYPYEPGINDVSESFSQITQTVDSINTTISDISDYGTRITALETTAEGFSATVQDIKENSYTKGEVDEATGKLGTDLENATSRVAALEFSAKQFKLDFDTLNSDGTQKLSNASCTIDDAGITLGKSDSEFSSNMNTTGLYLKSFDNVVAEYTKDGALINNLIVQGEFITNNLRMINVTVDGEERAYIHWI